MSLALTRGTDPLTSLKAARKMGSTNDTERLVLEALLEHGPMTTHRIAALMGLPVVTVSPRIKPLRKKLLVENTGMVEFGRSIWRALAQQPGLVVTQEMLDAAEALEKLAPYSRGPKIKETSDPSEVKSRIDMSSQAAPWPKFTPDLQSVEQQLNSLLSDLDDDEEKEKEKEHEKESRGQRVFDSFLSLDKKALMDEQTRADNDASSRRLKIKILNDLNNPGPGILDTSELSKSLEDIPTSARRHRKKATVTPAAENVIESEKTAESVKHDHAEPLEAETVRSIQEIVPVTKTSSSEITLNITITLKIDVSSNGVKISVIN